MRELLRRWLPWLKLVFVLAVLAGVALLFLRVLRSDELAEADRSRTPGRLLLDELTAARPLDLAAAALLYLAGLGFSAAFWLRLQARVGEPLPALAGARAYYISHLGKYAPLGKGWALLVRVTLAAQAGARPGVAALTGAYETLTTMASGALLAAAVLAFSPDGGGDHLWQALALLVLAGVPIVPAVFNRLVVRLTRRFGGGAEPPRALGAGTLLFGLGLTACGWLLLGASLVGVVHALRPAHEVGVGLYLHCVACVAVSWVAGFVVATPGGLGVRELIVQQMLVPRLGPVAAVVAAVLLRLLWTAAELVCAAALYPLGGGKEAHGALPRSAPGSEDSTRGYPPAPAERVETPPGV
jgi:uncharacterized membrane protein YbhN (UPF0104 family)